MTQRALILVDLQRDFAEGGALPVTGGNEVAERVARYVRTHGEHYAQIIATRDWHDAGSDNGGHFGDWPVHCVANSDGAQYLEPIAALLKSWMISAELIKGMGKPAYSAFDPDARVVGSSRPSLVDRLRGYDITHVDVVGLAKDHCVKATAVDGIAAGFNVRVFTDLTAAVDTEADLAGTIGNELEAAGVGLADSFELDLIELRENVGLPAGFSLVTDCEGPASGNQWFLQIEAVRPDTYTGQTSTGHGGRGYVTRSSSRSDLVRCAFGLFRAYMEHEAREAFTYRGRRVFGPHMDIDNLWSVADPSEGAS